MLAVVWRQIFFHSKPLIPMLMGVCLGIALSLVLAPFLEDGCGSDSGKTPVSSESMHSKGKFIAQADQFKISNARKPNFVDEKIGEDYGNVDDYEPRVIDLSQNQRIPADMNRKIMRPRYVSTELGIREKLLVSILTTKDTIETLGIAVNKTVNQHVSKTLFFMNLKGPSLPVGMSVVIFSDDNPHLLPLHMFKYVTEHYATAYDWFFFATDSTYVRAEKLQKLVMHTSIANAIYAGKPVPVSTAGKTFCDMRNGILLSQPVMYAVKENLEWCLKSAQANDDNTRNVGNCVTHAADVSCQDSVMGVDFGTYFSLPFDFNKDVTQASKTELQHLRDAFTVATFADDVTVYKTHRFFCEHDLNLTRGEIEQTKVEIESTAPRTPGKRKGLTWPLGVDPPSNPRTRFDVIQWDFFTDSVIYPDGDFNNVKELQGVDKEDVNDVLKVSLEKLNAKYDRAFTTVKLASGYRRFEPLRGLEYILDLKLRKRGVRGEVEKRVHLVRPLSFVEIVPMPYVTENTKLNLVLTVTMEDRDSVVTFLDSYAHTCLESGDYTYLFIVFVYHEDERNAKPGLEDSFSVLKSMIALYEKKYQNGARIAWMAIWSDTPTQHVVMDAVSRKFASDALFLLCTVGMELSIEFLNRVRMNTIENWQVFFPIAFWQYKPNLVYEEKPYPTTIEIDRNVGHFDNNIYVHSSFYNSDYQYARKNMISVGASQRMDMFEMFLKYHSVHVFRAVEPALKHRFQDRVCLPSNDEDSYHRCLVSRGTGLASRSQLAMLIFEQQQNVDRVHMDVIHQQNVDQQNVGQMKPNML